MVDKTIRTEIQTGVTGRESIVGLADDLDNVAKILEGELRSTAQAASAQLRELARQDEAISSFSRLQLEARDAARALATAEKEAAAYATQISQAGPPTANEAALLQRLQSAADGARTSLSQQNDALNRAQAELQAYGVSAHSATDVQRRLKQEVELVRESVNGLAPSYDRAASAASNAGETMVRTHRRIGDGVDSISVQLDRLQKVYATFLSLQGFKTIALELAKTADEAKNLQAKLDLVVGAGENLQKSWQGVTDISLRTHSALEETAVLMARITQVGKEAGLSTATAMEQGLALTETINQAIQLGGASAQASSAAITQLVQGLQSGVLRGDEFNSIMEQSPRLAKALADGLNVTTDELRKLAEAGILTSDRVIAALKGQSDTINTEFGKLPLTVGRALQDLSTQWTLLVSETDKATGASSAAATAIAALSSNLRTVAGLLIDVGQAAAAFVALRLAQQFLGIGAAAQTAATAVAVTNAQLTATGTAAATAAAGAGRLAGALASLRTFTLVGLIANFQDVGKWIGETAAKLAGYKDYTKELEAADRAAAQAAKEHAAAREAQAAATQAAIEKQFDLSKAASKAVFEFAELTKNGTSAAEAVKKVSESFDLSKVQGIKDFSATLDKLVSDGVLSAGEFKKAWADALNGKDLAQFEVTARAAFMGSSREAERLAQLMDGLMREAVRRTGLEFEQLQGGIGEASRKSINDLDALINSVDQLKAAGVDTGRVLIASLSTAINTADSQRAIDEVKARVEALRKALGDKVADGLLEQAEKKARDLKDALDQAVPGITSVREAMKQLGVTSDEALKDAAKSAKESYDYMVAQGTSSARELGEAFRQAADAAIKANDGIAPSWVKAQASLRGYEVVVDEAGKTTLRLKDATDKASEAHGRNARSIDDNRTALERLNAEREREIAAQEKANQLKERELKLYQEKWNIDAQGFSKNTAGNRIQAMAHTNASVYNQAKQAGLDEKLALIIADSFTYGANGSASVSAVNKAINDAIVQQAREKVAADEKAARDQARSEKKPSKTSSPTTSPSPAPAPSSQGGNTYVTNITLPDGRKRTVRYADAASKSENEELIRELVEGKGVAQ